MRPLPSPRPPRLQPGTFQHRAPHSHCVSQSPVCQEGAQCKGRGKHVRIFREPAFRRVRRGEVRTEPLPDLSEPDGKAAQRARKAGSADSGSLQGFRGRSPGCRGLREAGPGGVRACSCSGRGEPGQGPHTWAPWSFPEPQEGTNLWPLAHQQREATREGWVPCRVMDDLDTHFSCIC